jgi:hypothetical protein
VTNPLAFDGSCGSTACRYSFNLDVTVTSPNGVPIDLCVTNHPQPTQCFPSGLPYNSGGSPVTQATGTVTGEPPVMVPGPMPVGLSLNCGNSQTLELRLGAPILVPLVKVVMSCGGGCL